MFQYVLPLLLLLLHSVYGTNDVIVGNYTHENMTDEETTSLKSHLDR